MSDNPHIAGKYAIIAAVIAGIIPLLGIYLESALSTKSDPQVTEVPGGSTLPQSGDTPPIRPAQIEDEIIDKPYHPGSGISPVEKPVLIVDPRKSSAPTTKPTKKTPEIEPPSEPEDRFSGPPPKSTSTEFKTKGVSNSPALPNLFNNNFSGNIAITDIGKIESISLVINDLLTESNHQPTTSFFRSNFNTNYKNDFWNQGSDLLKRFELPKSLQCICIVKEQVTYEQRERFGEPFFVAKGFVNLKIINLNNDMATTLKIPVGGSGADKSRAYASFQDNFSLLFQDKNHLQKFNSCRK